MNDSISLAISELSWDKIPDSPGVYIFLDIQQNILYIGKAGNLKNRLRQYFSLSDNRPLIPYLLKKAMYIKTILTGDEREALLLENNLIKKNRPPYNIELKDDKSYPYLALTNEKYPSLVITRQPWKPFYFIKGPFTDSGLLKNLRNSLLTAYPLKKCSSLGRKACINYQMGLCPAPCEEKISHDEYMKNVKKIKALLEGKGWRYFSSHIREEMEHAVRKLQFEKAALLRDSLKMAEELRTKIAVEFSRRGNQTFFLFSSLQEVVFLTVSEYREGKLLALKNYEFEMTQDDPENILLSAISSYFSIHTQTAAIGVTPADIIDSNTLSAALGNRIKLIPVPAPAHSMMEKNQKHSISIHLSKTRRVNDFLSQLQTFLNERISSIMCIDVSTLYGEFTVVGAVWWDRGSFVKNNYRKFRIKTVSGQDDFASLSETAARLKKRWEDGSFPKPDLLLIDGGKGQLSSVRNILGETTTLAGIVKDRKKLKGHEKLLDIQGNEIELTDSPFSMIIKSIRDETHRFSITYNRNLRKKKITSLLSEIPGVGIKRELTLLKHFRTIDDIRSATIDKLSTIDGISKETAKKIINHLKK